MSSRAQHTPKSRSIRPPPSTTPAGAPPSFLFSTASTTPAGDPPRSSRFGSSYNPKKSLNSRYARQNTFAPPDHDYSDDEDVSFEEDDGAAAQETTQQSFVSSMPASLPQQPSRGLKRSFNGDLLNDISMASVVRAKLKNKPAAPLREPDSMIVETEHLAAELDEKIQSKPMQGDNIFTTMAAALGQTWAQISDKTTKSGSIGPASEDPCTHANYLASLLLQLHHPHTNTPQRQASRPGKAVVPTAGPQLHVPVPQALLNWLETYHRPFPDDYDTVHRFQPAPSAHESFWDTVYAHLLRGKLDRVIRLLRDAGWEHADTAIDDGAAESYTDAQLDCIDEVIGRCIDVFSDCPGKRYNDWDVKSIEWNVFRHRARAALEELEALAEGDELGDSLADGNVFQRSMGQGGLSLSSASRRAQSRLPWSIYENLKLLYGLALGQPEEILMTSQDWLEGSFYLTIWWDGSDDGFDASLDSNLRKGAPQKTREVDVAPLAAYRRRLADAFARVTAHAMDEEGMEVFQVRSLDLLEPALACLLCDEVSPVVKALRTLSMPIATSIVEIAAMAGWLRLARHSSRDGLMANGLDKEDLLVLSSYAPPTQTTLDDIDRDELLEEYADLLSGKAKIGNKEGWELAVAILTRLDQTAVSDRRIGELLEKLQLNNEETVDRVLDVCDNLGQSGQRRAIAERYADTLSESTQSYGAALIYYARAHAVSKLKSTISLLTSFCLLHSAAMPVPKLVDAKLDGLLGKARPVFKELAKSDLEAAALLSQHMSGYATLRKFYDTRETFVSHDLPLREVQRQAAGSIFAVLKSAADCIPGGLFDPEAESVIPVDGLLTLFGEVLPMLGQQHRIFTQQQVFALLATLEDFVAAPSRLRENAENLLAASLNAYREETNTATGPLKRTKSNLSESSWDLLATSSMMATSQGLKKGEKIQRAWDWRQGLVNGGIEGSEQQVVKLIREALVREVAGGWGGKLNW